MTTETPACGTVRARNRHLRLGEPVDDACKAAHNAYCKARNRALTRLAKRYPEAFAQLFAEELTKEKDYR